ncbi:MAG: MerR family transcriptional regulator [Rhodobacteraceae bacterium]|nr:MerR family transcriptional regulator [Paracoccaceae bacterium]
MAIDQERTDRTPSGEGHLSDTGIGEPVGYLPIGQASKILGLEQHRMRYWESRLDALKPTIVNGIRMYTADDIMLFSGLKVMLHERGMTMQAVQNLLETEGVDAFRNLGTVQKTEAFAAEFAPLPPTLDLDGATRSETVESLPDRAGDIDDADEALRRPGGSVNAPTRYLTVSLGAERYRIAVDGLRSLPDVRKRQMIKLRDRLAAKTGLHGSARTGSGI